jgi:aminoglycoside phosphotransferase (APT) family kinase protein
MAFADPRDPESKPLFDDYLSQSLGKSLEMVEAVPLKGGYRNSPWRIDALDAGFLCSYVLRLEHPGLCKEYQVMEQLASTALPTPDVWGFDPEGRFLGSGCFLMSFVPGQTLMGGLVSGEKWAEILFVDAVCEMQSTSRKQLGPIGVGLGKGADASGFLSYAEDGLLKLIDDPLVKMAAGRLRDTMPDRLEPEFGNGDLSPLNFIVGDGRLSGIIDFEFSGFSDPMFEFLSPIRWYEALRNRGLEARFCSCKGYDPDIVPWYWVLVSFSSWLGMLEDPAAELEGCTANSCRQDVQVWLEEF